MRAIPSREMFAQSEILIPACTEAIPSAVVYSNATQIGLKHFASRMLHHIYQPRAGSFGPVTLGAFPPGTRMPGGHYYWLEYDGLLAAEQINPFASDIETIYPHLTSLPFAAETIEAECLLVARYGDLTWGHWVAEILPRAIMAEHFYPGRFSYAIADQIIGQTEYGTRVLESLAAYGIAPERILPLRLDRHYQFSRLHGFTNIWSQGGMNPHVANIMRDDIATPPPSHSTGRLAVLRRDSTTRNLFNIDEITALLIARGFTVVDMAAQPFLNQVAFFRECHTVFGVLGSGLAGLVYSPEGVNVATAAPGDWDDTYFHRIIQHRRGSHADIRCPVIWDGQGPERDAPMVAFAAHVEAGLAALATPESERAPDGVLTVGGECLRRHIGQTILQLDFNEGGMAQMFLGKGWADPEPNHIWSLGPRSTLAIPIPFETDNIELQLDVIALVNPDFLIARKLDVTVNDIAVGSFSVADHATVACKLPAECFRDELMLNIMFETPFCVSAAATGHAPDQRPLGLGFVTLRIVSYPPVSFTPDQALQPAGEANAAFSAA